MKDTKPKIAKEKDFYTSANKALQKKRHTVYIRDVLKRHKMYKQSFDRVFTDKNPTRAIYTFRAKYIHSDKPVWREIEILGSQTFEDLAEEIIFSMDWRNDHLHGFSVPQKSRRLDLSIYSQGMEDDPHPYYKTSGVKVKHLDYEQAPKLKFTFDFGDSHEFTVTFRGLREVDKKEKIRTYQFPRLTDQRGVAPLQYEYDGDLEDERFDHEAEELGPIGEKLLKTLYDAGGSMELGEMMKEMGMDCAWRRKTCGKEECIMCDPKYDNDEGFEFDDYEGLFPALEDEEDFLHGDALKAIKTDLEMKGLSVSNIQNLKEPPKPLEFALYKEIKTWKESVEKLLHQAWEGEELWLFTEEGRDLIWYKNILSARVYRQLCNRWFLDNDVDYGEFDFGYTKHVLSECLEILTAALSELNKMDSPQKGKFLILLSQLSGLGEKIRKI